MATVDIFFMRQNTAISTATAMSIQGTTADVKPIERKQIANIQRTRSVTCGINTSPVKDQNYSVVYRFLQMSCTIDKKTITVQLKQDLKFKLHLYAFLHRLIFICIVIKIVTGVVKKYICKRFTNTTHVKLDCFSNTNCIVCFPAGQFLCTRKSKHTECIYIEGLA